MEARRDPALPYVMIFGPLKSGKSTLMNAIAAAYVSEVSSLPAYPSGSRRSAWGADSEKSPLARSWVWTPSTDSTSAPAASTRRLQPGSTTVVPCDSVTSAGPSSRAPGRNSARRNTGSSTTVWVGPRCYPRS